MADIVINPAIGKIDFFSVKGDNVTNTLKLTGNTLLVTGPLSASSISTGGGGAFVTSVQPTSNYLSKFTGNSTIANSLIYDNGTNVGIGTTTSAARLQINSTTSGATLLRADGTSGTLFTVVDDLSDSLMSVNNSAGLPVLEVFADDRIVGGQYGTNDFVVINNKVGIGTNNPTAKLQVTSSVSTPSAAFLGGNVGIGTTSPTQLLELKKTTGSAIALLNYNDSVKFNINASSAGVGYVGMVSNHDLLFVTNDTERARVTSTGCVGIGTTSVRLNSLLTVYGSGAFGTSAYGFYVGTDATGAFLDAGTQLIRMFTGQQERIRIDANGNVGIGTSSPTSRLHISSSSAADEVILGTVGNDQVVGGRTGGSFGIATKSTSNGNLILTANNGMYLRTGGSNDRLFIASGGNVGIGTTSPISLLDVRSGYITAGTGVSTSGTTILAGYYTSGHLTVLGTEQSSGGPVLGYAVTPSTSATGAFLSSTTIAIPRSAYTQDGGTHRWFTGPSQTVAIGSAVTTSEKMRLDTNGNLGIGTSSPATLLHVDTSGADARIRVSAGTNTVQGGMIANSGTSLIYAGSITNHGFSLRTNDTDRVRIDTSGNVGIGTSTLFAKFVVSNGSGENIEFTPGNATVNGGLIENINRSSGTTRPDLNLFTSNGSNGSIKFYTNGVNERMRVNYDGNVGIGTSSPTTRLHVYGSGGGFEFGVGSPNCYIETIDRASVGKDLNTGYYTRGSGSFTWNNGSYTERMRINGNGNVGIGTTTPGYKLDVNGTIGLSGSPFASYSSNYNRIFEPAGNVAIYLGNAADPSNYFDNTNHVFRNRGGSSVYALINSNGNLGIGTTSPTTKLAVSDGTTIAQVNPSSNVAYFGTVNNYPMALSVNSSEKVRVDTNGNVGIGTSSPSRPFHVYSSNNAPILLQGTTAGAWLDFQSSTSNLLSIGADGTNGIGFYNRTTSTNLVTISNGGNVGIGTTSPVSKLHIEQIQNAESLITLRNDRQDFGDVAIFGITAQNGVQSVSKISFYRGGGGSSGYLTFSTKVDNASSLTEKVRIDGAGNVGIGTSSPRVLLDLAKANNVGQVLLIGETSTNIRTGFGLDSSTAGMRIFCPNLSSQAIDMGGISTSDGSTWTRNHSFGVAGKNSWLNEQGGNVGIGTSSPSATLTVIATNNTGSRIQLGTASTSTFMDANKVNDFMVLTAPFGNNPASVSNAGAKWGIKMNGSIDGINTKGKAACIYAVSEDGAGYNRTVGMALHTSGFDLDNAERVRITNGGYVGIGTSTTTSGLQIQTEGTNTASGSFLFVRSTNASFGGGAIGVGYQYAAAVGNNYTPFRIRGGSTNAIFTINSSGTVYAGDTTGAVIYGNHDPYYTFNQDTNTGMDWAAADTLTFKTGGTERLRIDTNGNVGIGTTVQNQKLSIYPGTTGGISLQDSGGTTRSYFFIDNTNPTYSTGIRTTNYYIDFDSSGGAQNAIRFYTGTGAIGTGTERMRVTGTGNIGIGTSSPISKLNAYASGSNLSVLKIDGGNGTLFEVTDQLSGSLFSVNTIAGLPVMEAFSNNRVVMGKYNANDFVISGSRVGIGTSNPSNKTTIEADATGVSFADNGIGQLVIRGATNTAKRLALGIDTTNNIGVIQSQLYGTGQYPLALNPAGGSVGVGVLTNLSTVGVGSSAATTLGLLRTGVIAVGGNIGPSINFYLAQNATTSLTGDVNLARITTNPIDNWGGRMLFLTKNADANNGSAPTEKMRLTEDGNLGIGTSSPTGKLEVRTNAASTYVFTGTSTSGYTTTFTMDDTASYFGHDSAVRSIIFRTDSTARLTIKNDGNVGIGTTVPSALLHTVTTTAGSTVIRADGTSGTLFSVVDDLSDSLMSVNNSAGLPVFEVFANDRIVGGQYGVNDFVVINNKVGIGTNNPSGKLHVSGSNATSIIDGLSIGRGSGNVVTNTVIGNGALSSNTTGFYNSAIGYKALYSNTFGEYNTAVGYQALFSNTEGINNDAFGAQSLYSNTFGYSNSAFGMYSMYSNTIGNNNSAFGYGTLYENIEGNLNCAFGAQVLRNNTLGNYNNSFGYESMRYNTTGENNSAFGAYALRKNTTGIKNNAFGNWALESNTFGYHNNAFGYLALTLNTIGNNNSAFGYRSLYSNTTGSNNNSFGYKALFANTTSNNNAFGYQALYTSTTGSRNSAFGHMALRNLTTASDNTAFGYKTLLSGSNGQFSQRNTAMGSRASEAGGGVSNSAFGFEALRYSGFNANSAFGAYTLRNQRTTGTANSNSAFGYKALINNISGYTNSAFGANAGTTVTGGINLTIIGASAEPSSATATNQITLGNSSVTSLRCQVTTITALSDFRDKTDITDIQLGLSFVEKLRPVTFKWDRREWYTDGNRDGSKKDSVIQAGFIAQELKALQEEEGVEFLKLVYEDNPDKLEATPGNLMIPLIKAVQELSTKVKTLEAKVQILESK